MLSMEKTICAKVTSILITYIYLQVQDFSAKWPQVFIVHVNKF